MMAAMPGGEFGLMGAVLLALVAALVWHMRATTTELISVVRANTAAMSELRAALRDQTLCPYRELEREQLDLDAERAAG